ncbi:pyruvate, water dikinase regulatory protein [Varunaivibrio sulfuroxidans]|uniref:Putative pyruvate, phosphate dikinase regulatory protein n=1 Tax=Varunaivibrio sulfuroxidans TaxID=1773489 RepID=A0A4R3JH85_9PROT|nr:pyruvate, water dikinase regulatory protein [Varunaivibrio sulfuroxidans]TCS64865.1 hypothetical protein EDD55_101196 [Varunaivibrio sulfuroxidans]WES29838.1 kinase/pyrophosphorylase [Varunaivibrio sulfuroxidans]
MIKFHLHLVSDSTGETLNVVSRACLVQFEDVTAEEHLWPMIRKPRQIEEVLNAVQEKPGFVIYTLVNGELSAPLENGCRKLNIPCVDLLDPVVTAMGEYLGAKVHARPGRQHIMDAEYFARIEAIDFALRHDDGQSYHDLNDADVVLLGVSRTSKTPTCIYLANRGVRAANVPIVPGSKIPDEINHLTHPLIVGLTKDPRRLVQIRKNRLELLGQSGLSDYVDLKTVAHEVGDARKYYEDHDWPVIDVTRKSIEETASTILKLQQRHQENLRDLHYS